MKKLIFTLTLAAMSSASQADDTELFTGTAGGATNTNIVFVMDTSRSMTAWATNDQDDDTIRPAYDPSVIYEDSRYSFDPDKYYLFAEDSIGRLDNLTSDEIDTIEQYEFSFNSLNCSLKTSMQAQIDNTGLLNPVQIAHYSPSDGWSGPDRRTDLVDDRNAPILTRETGSFTQCYENSRYTYNGTSFRYLLNPSYHQSINAPFTNNLIQRVCTRYRNNGSCRSYRYRFVNYDWDGFYDVIYSGNYLNYMGTSFGDDSERLTRLEVVQKAAKEVISTTSLTNINFSLMRFSSDGDGGFVSVPMTPLSEISDEFAAAIDSFDGYGGTPIEETLYEAYRYMSGGEVLYGTDSNSGIWNQPEDKESWLANSIYFDTSNLNRIDDTPSDSRAVSGSNYIAPDFSGCEPNSKIILFSDGEPSGDNASSYIETMISNIPFPNPQPSYLSKNCRNGNSNNQEGSCAEELAYFLSTQDHRPDVDGLQVMKVDTMGGFVTANAGAEQKLRDIAAAGNGTFYPVDDYASMVDNFRDAIVEVIKDPSSFTSPAIAVSSYNSLEQSDELYYAVFRPTDTAAWNGNLKRYRFSGDQIVDRNGEPAINPDTGFFKSSSSSFWSDVIDGSEVTEGGAANRFGDKERRILGIDDGDLTQLTVSSLLNYGDSILGTDLVDEDGSLQLTEGISYKQSLVNWILGQKDDGTPRLEMEDPIHSRPTIANYGSQGQVVFVGTNSGYLHAFDTSNGQEVYSIIPNEVIKNSNFYLNPSLANASNKVFGLDGAITLWHDDSDYDGVIDSGEKAYIYVAMRRGGHTYYAFDISSMTNPSLAWKVSGPYKDTRAKNVPSVTPGFERLGQTWSALKPARMKIGGKVKTVLLAGGGYDPDEDGTDSEGPTSRISHSVGNTIYIIDAETGAMLWSAYDSLSDLNADMTSGFAADISPIDRDSDGLVDLIYAADLGGRLWRFDFNQSDAGFATGTLLADINTSAADGAVGNRRFFSAPDVSLFDFDERELIISIGSGYRAHPLTESVSDRFYIFRDQHGLSGAPESYEMALNDELIDIKSKNAFDLDIAKKGWYLDLQGSGEKSITPSITLNGTITFSTLSPTVTTPEPGVCTGNLGQNKVYRINLLSAFNPPTYCELYPESSQCEDKTFCELNPSECELDICDISPEVCDPQEPPKIPPPPTVIIGNCESPDDCVCEKRAINILAGTQVSGTDMDMCDLVNSNYWKEEE